MPVFGAQPGASGRHVFDEPLAVRERHHQILLPLPHRDRDADRRELEPPGADEREVVVEPPPRPAAERPMERRRHELAERAGHLGLVDLGDQAPELGHDLVRFHGAESLYVRSHPAEQLVGVARGERVLDLVVLPHPHRPVQALRVVGRDPGDRRGGADAVGQQRRARERMGPAAGPAHREEPLGAEVIGERGGIACRARDAATLVPARVPEPGSRDRHEADPALGGGTAERFERHRGAGAPVMEDDQRAVRVALVDGVERSAVRRSDEEFAAHAVMALGVTARANVSKLST